MPTNVWWSDVKIAMSCMLGVLFLYPIVEPAVLRAAATTSDTFTVRQQITDEITFLVTAPDVTMAGTIAGITGGNATGTTSFVVRSNAAAGFNVDIAFSNNPAMRGDVTLSNAIRDYGVPGTEPTFAFNASSAAQFAYTVSASTTTDLDPSFLDNGTTCNTGSSFTANACWKGPATSNFRIINRSTPAPTGATTTLTFRVNVPNNPSPAVTQDFYTATATLTATNQ